MVEQMMDRLLRPSVEEGAGGTEQDDDEKTANRIQHHLTDPRPIIRAWIDTRSALRTMSTFTVRFCEPVRERCRIDPLVRYHLDPPI
jgi:hypothetical protein